MGSVKGRFIVICGIDGSGKTTQEDLLVQTMKESGRQVVQTKNPTDWYRTNPIVRSFLDSGQKGIRSETMALLAAADRMLQLDTEIEPLLNKGIDVVCNRYVYSTFAYFRARGADMKFVEAINGKVREPDLGVLLTIDPEIAIRRIRLRDGDSAKYEEKNPAYLGLVQEEMIRRWPTRFLQADASDQPESIATKIADYITKTSQQYDHNFWEQI